MYERILVPLDGSRLAEIAVPYAEELASKLGSEVTLITVLPSDSESEGQYHSLYRFYMQETAKTIGQKAIKVKSVIVTGDAAEQVADYADKNNYGLIIIGTREKSTLKRWILGSVADKLISITSCPVACISAKDTESVVLEREILRRALVILDGTAESEVIIPYIEELASKLDIEVTLFQLVEPAYEYYAGGMDLSRIPVSRKKMNSITARARRRLKKLANSLEGKGITVTVKVIIGSSAEAIIKVASKIDADLLAMATHSRTGISRWIFGDTRDEIINIGNTLVLLVTIPE